MTNTEFILKTAVFRQLNTVTRQEYLGNFVVELSQQIVHKIICEILLLLCRSCNLVLFLPNNSSMAMKPL